MCKNVVKLTPIVKSNTSDNVQNSFAQLSVFQKKEKKATVESLWYC